MKIKIIGVLLGIFFGFSMVRISEANTMDSQSLSVREEAIIPIAAFTASGELDRLKEALNEGLDQGLTVNEIKEVLVQMYAYAGFPRSLNGIGTFMEVVEERRSRGIEDQIGKEATVLPIGQTLIELGTKNQTQLVGAAVSGPLYDFVPAIDEFLKGHLFGDIFGRDNLSFKDREIVTIAALANLGGVNPQPQRHFSMGMNTGLSEEQLQDLIKVLRDRVGVQEAENTEEVLARTLRRTN